MYIMNKNNWPDYISQIRVAHVRNILAIKPAGFTLVEMMIVIAIVGLLAAIVIGSIGESRSSAQSAVALNQMETIAKALVVAGSPQPLSSITGSLCTMCSCRDLPTGTDLGTLEDYEVNSPQRTCLNRWESAINAIAANSSYISDPSQFYRDPWGSPYFIDENELEFPPPGECRPDNIRSVGPDRIWGTGDEIDLRFPFRTITCAD